MSVLGRVGVSVQTQADPPLDPNGLRVRKIEQKHDADPMRDRVAVTGQKDATLPTGALTQGVTFTAGQAINIAHGLGRAATGFLVTDCQTSAHALINDAANLPADLKATHMRLKHTGGATTLVRLVFV